MRGITFIFVAACAVMIAQAVNFSDEQKAKIQEHYEKCTASTGVDKTLIAKGRKGEFTKDDKLAQYYFCVLSEIGIVNNNGVLQPDVVRAKLPPGVTSEVADKLINACKNVSGKDKFDTTQLIFECIFKSSPTPPIYA